LTPEAQHVYRPQCGAVTEDGLQCRNPSRESSKYCSSHFGYQPKVVGSLEAEREDTRPRYGKTPDTKPSVRRKAALA
jgi:hypothetical protein